MEGSRDPAVPAVRHMVEACLSDARVAALTWRAIPVQERARIAGRLRRSIARQAVRLAESVGAIRPLAETLAAEILPLADAAAFLARRSASILATRRLGGRGRPLWLFGVDAEIHREPCGVVLILAPVNYPLFLPGVQALQALVAGNAVCVKPAPGVARPMVVLAELLAEAGLPPGLFHVLPDDRATAEAAARARFDRIVLTGSAGTGQAVLRAAAENLVPTTMELSGNDAVFVMPGADLRRVARAVAYGSTLNGGATCIAPHRVFVPVAQAAQLEAMLVSHVAARAGGENNVSSATMSRLDALLDAAILQGGRRVALRNGASLPAILADASPHMALLQEDLFAPWLAIVPVADMNAALAAAACCPYSLGASIFGPAAAARALAGEVAAGSVCINDLIAPTADPRLPFGGRGRSGFGVTRGVEGLLEMTVLKVISTRRGGLLPHLSPSMSANASNILRLIRFMHAGLRVRQAASRK